MVKIRLPLAAACSAAVVTWCATASAGEAVLAVIGKSGDADLAAVRESAARGIEAHGWRNASPAPDAIATATLTVCVREKEPAECGRFLRAWPAADRAMLIEIEARKEPDGETTLRLRGWVVSSAGDLLAVDTRHCERCRAETLAMSARELARALAEKAGARTSKTTLLVRSRPAGARILIDNREIGRTDFSITVSPGKHAVSIDKIGYEIEIREVVALEGTTTTVAVDLRATGGAAAGNGQEGGPRARGHVLPWLLMGTGGAALATGIALMLMNEPRVEDGDQGAEFRSSRTPGIIMGAAGAVALVTGGYLLLTRRPRRAATPVVAAGSASAWIGLVGRF